MKIILGSSSPWRRKVLEKAGLIFSVMSPEIDEKAIRHTDPRKLTMMIALAKAQALLPRIVDPAILITCDQVMYWGGKIQEKPRSKSEARAMVESYHLEPTQSFTAVVVTNTQSMLIAGGVHVAQATFSQIPSDVVDDFVAREDAYTNAGAFSIGSPLINPFISHMDYPESLQGMPLALTFDLINQVA